MKNQLFTLAAVIFSAATIQATTIWNETTPHHVTWDTTLKLTADQFSNAEAGNLLTFTLQNATDVIELKANGAKLPGTCFSNIDSKTSYSCYLTQSMADSCKKYGMEICGKAFDVVSIDLADGKAHNLKEGKTIWTGYFWVDIWTTLELFKEALSAEDLSQYKALRIYHEASATGYILNLKANWNDAGNIANLGPNAPAADAAFQYQTGYAELDLTQINPLTVIETVASDRLMIQGNKESLEAFNLTDVVLVPRDATPSAIESARAASLEGIYDLQGHRIESVTQSGLYIINGQKQLISL